MPLEPPPPSENEGGGQEYNIPLRKPSLFGLIFLIFI